MSSEILALYLSLTPKQKQLVKEKIDQLLLEHGMRREHFA